MRYFTCFDLLTLNFSQCVTALSYSPPYRDGGMSWSVNPKFITPLIGCQALAFVTRDYSYWTPNGDLHCAYYQTVASYA